MNQNNHPAIKHKLGLLEFVDQLKNVSRACKVMGVSRDTFYRVQSAYEEGGKPGSNLDLVVLHFHFILRQIRRSTFYLTIPDKYLLFC